MNKAPGVWDNKLIRGVREILYQSFVCRIVILETDYWVSGGSPRRQICYLFLILIVGSG